MIYPPCPIAVPVAGPLLALGLVALVGIRWAIGLSVIPGLLAALSILYAIRHIPRTTTRARVPLKITVRPLLRGRLGQVLLGVSFFETTNVATTLLILRATQLLVPSLGVTTATEVAMDFTSATTPPRRWPRCLPDGSRTAGDPLG